MNTHRNFGPIRSYRVNSYAELNTPRRPLRWWVINTVVCVVGLAVIFVHLAPMLMAGLR